MIGISEIQRRVGKVSQVASTRHVVLDDGRAEGVAATDFDTDARLRFTMNFGFPLLDAASGAVVGAAESRPFNERSAQGMAEMLAFSDPVPGYEKQNFSHRRAVDAEGTAYAALINPDLHGGLGVCIKFDGRALPILNEWKMMGEGDYVASLEPCNAPCENRGALRQKGLLPFLAPGEVQEIRVEIGVLEGAEEIHGFKQRVASQPGLA